MLQVPGLLHGGRSRWGDAGLSPLRRSSHHSAAKGANANADHMSLSQEGQADPSAAPHGGGGHCQPHS